jgi:type I restriction enzyme, S subunit
MSMTEWKEYKFSDFVEINPTVSLKGTEEYSFVEMKDLQDGNKYCLPSTERKPSSGARFQEGDTLFARITPCLENGKICKVKGLKKGIGFGSTEFLVFRRKDKISDNDFIFYLSRWDEVRAFAESNFEGTSGRQRVNKNCFENLNLNLPLLTEQISIAQVLSSLDDKIDLLHRQNKTLEQLAETLFRQWFVEEADESWEITTLQTHTEIFRGLSYKGSGLTDIQQGVPMHNLNSVYEGGGYKYDGIKFYNGDYKERHLVNAGDIIVTNTEQGHELRLIGFPAIVPDYYGNTGVFSQHIYKLAPLKQSYLSREFIYYLLMTSTVREQVVAATNGSTVNMLAIDGLQRPEFQLPPKEKVKKFTLIIKDYWIKKNVNHNQIRTLTQLRNTLLPKLMNGEVRVKN